MKTYNYFNPLGKWEVAPAGPLVLAAGVAQKVYDNGVNAPDGNIGKLVIQNIGTDPIFWRVNDTASNLAFHGIIPADSAANAGNGGQLYIDGYTDVRTLSLYSVNGTSVAIFKSYVNR